MTQNTLPVCNLQVIFRGYVQESYETASNHARARAAQLRRAGFRVSTSPMGLQVTNVGMVRMTMLNATGDIDNLPPVQVERI